MTPEQSRNLRVGQHVTWQGDGQDRGVVVARDWTGVQIKWNNGLNNFYHHNDMHDVTSAPVVV